MAQEYILISEHVDFGNIALSKVVFEMIAQISVEEEALAFLLEPTALHKPVQCRIQDNKLNVLLEIKIKYGSNVNLVCENLQNRIFQSILEMTNLRCNLVDVKVVGFIF